MAHTEEWIEVQDAAKLLSHRSGHTVSADYVRLLAHKGKIRWKPKDGRQNYYLRSDVEEYRVKRHQAKEAA